MANALGYYNPVFYAQEALIQLEKALGMAGRVFRGIDPERRAFGRGETINIRRPGVFTPQDAPSTAQDLDPGSVQVTLAYWREVKFKLTDKELTFTGERIIDEHIRPAAVALADDIDQKLAALYYKIPWTVGLNATPGSVVSDITTPRRTLFDNAVPLGDESNMHYMVNGEMEANLLANAAFAQWQGAGPTGQQTQLRGSIGRRFGLNFFANQNVPIHTPNAAADATGAINNGAGVAKGATTIAVDGVTASASFKKGDTFVIAGNTQRYVITADTSADGTGAIASLPIYPALVQNYPDNAVVTIDALSGTAYDVNLAFHRDSFILAMAPLSEMGRELGAKIATISDPITNLALRSRLYYVGNSSEVHVALDVLFGVEVLNANMAVRCRG